MPTTQRSSSRMVHRRLEAIVVCSAIASLKLCAAEEPPVVNKPARQIEAAKAESPDERLPVGRTITGATAYEQRIQLALDRPFTHEFEDVPLAEVVKLIEATAKCNVIVDRSGLDGAGIEQDTKFWGKARGRSLRRELHELLNPHRIGFVVRNDCIWLTTEELATNYLSLRLYQVHDLLLEGSVEREGRTKFSELRELLLSLVTVGSWREHGGTLGEMFAIETPGVEAFVVSQNEESHEAIEQLLGKLRAARVEEVRRLQEPAAQAKQSLVEAVPARLPRGKVIYSQVAGDVEIRKALERPATFVFADATLADVVAEVRKQFGIGIELEISALTADGKGPDTKIAFRWRDGTLGNALRMLLEEHGLEFRVHEGTLVVTTKTDAETKEPTYIYQVQDLLMTNAISPRRPSDFASLFELIRTVVNPEVWREGGGNVGIHGFEAPGLQVLNITTTVATHREVERLFHLLREAYEPKLHELQLRRPVAPPTALPHPGTRGMGGGF